MREKRDTTGKPSPEKTSNFKHNIRPEGRTAHYILTQQAAHTKT